MFFSRTRRMWGHIAIFIWSNLIVDRSHKLVSLQSPVGYSAVLVLSRFAVVKSSGDPCVHGGHFPGESDGLDVFV